MLFLAKQLALDNLVDERTKAVILLADGGNNRGDGVAIRDPGSAAGGVSDELGGERSGELVPLLEQEALVFVDVCEGPAVGQRIARIDFGTVQVTHLLSIDDDRLPVASGAVVFAPTADDIEALEGETRRIDVHVA